MRSSGTQIGKNIDIYLMEGEAAGRWQANLSNWNCTAYKIPRNDLRNCDDIPEIFAPGVYFLFGRDDESGSPFVYVGEGDNVSKRILQPHSFERDGSYWTEVVVFVTPDGTLDKARIKYLENRFHSIVVEAGRYVVKNGNTPTQSPVQKKVQDMLEEFIINAKLVMLSLGHKVFEPQPSAATNSSEEDILYFTRNHGRGGNAKGKVADDGFWVLKDSFVYPQLASYLSPGVVKLRKQYAKDIDKKGVLQKDVCFGSPSYAASFVCGKNTNGLTAWKNAEGKTLKEINGETEELTPIEDELTQVEEYHDEIMPEDDVSEIKDCRQRLHLVGKLIAYAYEMEKGFRVEKGSQISMSESDSCGLWIRKHRKKLFDDGSVVDGVFAQDVLFDSPSVAAACILGWNTNGRTAWRNDEGKTLKEIQESKQQK